MKQRRCKQIGRRFDYCQVFEDIREAGLFPELNDYQLFERIDNEYKLMNEVNPFRHRPTEHLHLSYHRFAKFRWIQYRRGNAQTVTG